MIFKKNKNEEKALELASQLGDNAGNEEIQKMEGKLPSMNKGPIAKIWDKVQDLYRAFMSEDTPASVRTLIIGGLLYLVLPFDIIPDAIPGAGLLDDAAVIGFIWKKLADITKVGAKIVAKTAPAKLGEQVTKAYEKAFEAARMKLQGLLRKQERKTILNCFINLGVFLVALLFLSFDGELSMLLASLCLLVTLLRSLYSFAKTLPEIAKLWKAWRKKRNLDGTVAEYLRLRYPFIAPLEKLKEGIVVLEGIPTLESMVSMQRKALRKTILSVGLALLIATGLVFVLRHMLLALNTPYTFRELLSYPFVRLWSLFMK
ncbi:YkvA family protein [uncultured Sphaerochaeta sp.]|uniref:YkvA family protein n=1 Tax=uncultured Sphaerochaeta sp. TaxID=886478 RepID=UPI002A0A465B|nr:YkvA family protein [uncultured Sphaerochaeta sp.]